MAIYKVQAPDGKTITLEGPAGATEAQIIQAAQAEYAKMQQAPAPTPEEQAMAIADAAGPAPAPAQPQPQRQFIGQSIPQAITAPIELLATTLTGGTTGLLGYGAGGLAGILESIRNGTYGTSVGANAAAQRAMEGLQRYTYQPRTELAQQALQTVGEFAEAAKLAPVPVTAVPQALARGAVQQAIPPARQAATVMGETALKVPGVEKAVTAVSEAAAKAPETIENVFRPGQRARRTELAEIIKQDPYNTEAVRFNLSGDTITPDVEADKALKQGWREGVVSVVKAGSDRDRSAMERMLNIYRQGKKNEKYRALNRPGDVVGESLQSRVDYIDAQRRQAGKQLEEVANTQLRGQSIDYEPVVNQFLSGLDELGVKVRVNEQGRRVVDLKDSDIQGDVQAEKLLNNVLDRMSNVTGPPDAEAMHKLKRYLDTQISYGAKPQMNPLTAAAERQVKDLRSNINQTLGSRFPEYRQANERYSDTLTALKDLQTAAGTSIDFESPNVNRALGTALRKITSNYATRVKLMDALDQAEQVAKKYGMKVEDDIINQVVFANEIDRMFGAVADTSLKGQVAQAAETGLNLARQNNTERAFSLIEAGIRKAQGINEENALKRMSELLRRRTRAPSPSGQQPPETQPGTALVPLE